MAHLYILTEEQSKSGKRPKTPRQKTTMWKKICLVLTFMVIIEHAALLYVWMK